VGYTQRSRFRIITTTLQERKKAMNCIEELEKGEIEGSISILSSGKVLLQTRIESYVLVMEVTPTNKDITLEVITLASNKHDDFESPNDINPLTISTLKEALEEVPKWVNNMNLHLNNKSTNAISTAIEKSWKDPSVQVIGCLIQLLRKKSKKV